jgi:hypothetical protein
MNKEIWQPIFEYNNYVISNFGNVKNVITNKLLKFDYGKFGHCRVCLCNKNGKKRFLVHRLVAKHFIPNPNKYNIVNHLDCNPLNNKVTNLEWTTVSGNVIHAYKNNRIKPLIGTKNGMSVLKDEQVIEIINLWNKGLTQKEISDKIGVTRSCIAHITQGNRWIQYSHLIERK